MSHGAAQSNDSAVGTAARVRCSRRARGRRPCRGTTAADRAGRRGRRAGVGNRSRASASASSSRWILSSTGVITPRAAAHGIASSSVGGCHGADCGHRRDRKCRCLHDLGPAPLGKLPDDCLDLAERFEPSSRRSPLRRTAGASRRRSVRARGEAQRRALATSTRSRRATRSARSCAARLTWLPRSRASRSATDRSMSARVAMADLVRRLGLDARYVLTRRAARSRR